MVGLVPLFSIVIREGGGGREGELSLSSLAAPLGGEGGAKNHFSPRRFPYRKEEEERKKRSGGKEERKRLIEGTGAAGRGS